MNSYDEILIKPKTYTKEQVQKLIDYVNEIFSRTYSGEYKSTFKTKEEYMAWVAQNLREAGFHTEKVGSSWGVLK